MSKNQKSGYGLIIGAAIGTLLFILTQQAYLIAIGAGLGLVFGSMLAKKKNSG